jgi:putative lysine decarboxylase
MLQTTSPSYLLMGSLDINQQILRMDGYNLIKNWDADIKYFYQEAAQIAGLGLIDRIDLDETKVSITMSALGLSGPELAEELEKRNIWVELTHGDYVMLMTGLGNERGDYEDVLSALRDLSAHHGGRIQDVEPESTTSKTESAAQNAAQKQAKNEAQAMAKNEAQEANKNASQPVDKIAELRTPSSDSALIERLEQRRIPDTYEEIPLYSAEGRVLYESIIPYPPGTPIACPGEVLSKSVILYVRDQLVAQHVVLGVDEEGRVKVESDCVLFKEI